MDFKGEKDERIYSFTLDDLPEELYFDPWSKGYSGAVHNGSGLCSAGLWVALGVVALLLVFGVWFGYAVLKKNSGEFAYFRATTGPRTALCASNTPHG